MRCLEPGSFERGAMSTMAAQGAACQGPCQKRQDSARVADDSSMGDASEFIRSVGNLPAMPQVAMRVLNFDENDSRNGSELARVVGADPGLSARLIKVSNSAYYGFARRLGTVREAVLVIGFRQVRQIVLGAALMDTWKRIVPCEGFDTDIFWEHSLLVAMAAETAARMAGEARPEEAFTAGILHDMGLLAMLVGDRNRMVMAIRDARAGTPVIEAERKVFGFGHAEAGEALARHWNFPEGLAIAIGRHHDRDIGRDDGLPGMVALGVRAANASGLFGGYRDIPAEFDDEEMAEVVGACGGFEGLITRARAFVESVSTLPRRDRAVA